MKTRQWEPLRYRISSVRVVSCADGMLRIRPYWRRQFVFGDQRLPGILTRMGSANYLEELINEALHAVPNGWAGISHELHSGDDRR